MKTPHPLLAEQIPFFAGTRIKVRARLAPHVRFQDSGVVIFRVWYHMEHARGGANIQVLAAPPSPRLQQVARKTTRLIRISGLPINCNGKIGAWQQRLGSNAAQSVVDIQKPGV